MPSVTADGIPFINQLTKVVMTNVSKNQNWKKEFEEHLVKNGFVPSDGNSEGEPYFFFAADLGVMVTANSIDLVNYKLERGKQVFASFTGIGALNLGGWMMLMHLTGMVPLGEVVFTGPSECVTLARYEGEDLAGNIKRAFDPHNQNIMTVH